MLAPNSQIVLSPQQQTFIDFVRDGRGSCFLEAVAGAGKTFTLIQALKETKGSVGFAAFNKKIADEIKAKAAPLNLGNRVRVGTFHSFGFGAWRYVYKNVEAGPEAARKKADMTVQKLEIPRILQGIVLKMVGLAKQRAMMPTESGNDQLWWDIIDHFDLAYEIEDDRLIDKAIELAKQSLRFHIDTAPEIIDFDDMIYMPLISGIRMWQNDEFLTDEAQDTNPARRGLVRKMLRPNGRAYFVGDRHQAIYGFTGADNDAIDKIISEFNCKTLPLTVTYRCPKAVVAQAQQIVSHIQAHESAPDGLVWNLEHNDMLKQQKDGVLNLHATQDAILCRNTKPLVETAYRLIRQGVACHVEGRDIGTGLLNLVNKFDAKTIQSLRDRIQVYAEKQAEKLKAKGRETQAEALLDRAETVFVIMDAQNCKTVDDLRKHIMSLFLDSENEQKPTLTLSTVHKAKGREWQRVFVLGYNVYMPSRWARQQWQLDQENNLIYVAYTRAQKELVLLGASEIK